MLHATGLLYAQLRGPTVFGLRPCTVKKKKKKFKPKKYWKQQLTLKLQLKQIGAMVESI